MKFPLTPSIDSPNDDSYILIDYLVSSGSSVTKDIPVAIIDTSKTTFEVVSPHSGHISFLYQQGSEIPIQKPFAIIDDSLDSIEEGKINSDREPQARFSQAALKLLHEHKLNPELFSKTGLVTSEEIQKHLSQKNNHSNKIILSKLKRNEIASLEAGPPAQLTSSVTVILECSIGSDHIEGTLPIIIYETSKLLKLYPCFNGYFDDALHLHSAINIALALDMGEGLKVPIICNADQRSPSEIEVEIKSMLSKYISNTFSISDFSNPSFTISDLSGIGAYTFQPIINQKQSAILGVGISHQHGEPTLTLTLTFDHRIATGRDATLFLNELKKRLEEIGRASCRERV